jgi:hypothetical protein
VRCASLHTPYAWSVWFVGCVQPKAKRFVAGDLRRIGALRFASEP